MDEAIEEEIENIIWGIGTDSYNRFEIFLNHCKFFIDWEYWYGLRLAYTCSDNLFQYKGLVRAAFVAKVKDRKYLMTESERVFLKGLPQKVTIYRAMTVKESKSNQFGVSWTLSKDVADFYKEKYIRNHATKNEPKTIIEKVVTKKNIIAYFNGREEQEIIYL